MNTQKRTAGEIILALLGGRRTERTLTQHGAATTFEQGVEFVLAKGQRVRVSLMPDGSYTLALFHTTARAGYIEDGRREGVQPNELRSAFQSLTRLGI